MGNTFRGGQDHPHKKTNIVIGSASKRLPILSVQCFEARHGECSKDCKPFSPDKCECSCHRQDVYGLVDKLKKDPRVVRCDECKGKPDYMYFNDASGEILSVICQSCQDLIERSIKALGRSFCTDPHCKECGR